ncbi:hypothetical protein M422DRAFT_265959 [Sphaerobolus stellatus SS14]|uniref:Uncharacterized protein n=1 Tax=Sphaerobolus stellatus (strain SS14) TaxID=990650 RepID=A0A0C9V4C5_SPHS4|nr:hypothetical protein M422DRAFT_265959 [Sphaerobolus stellatus SS14]
MGGEGQDVGYVECGIVKRTNLHVLLRHEHGDLIAKNNDILFKSSAELDLWIIYHFERARSSRAIEHNISRWTYDRCSSRSFEFNPSIPVKPTIPTNFIISHARRSPYQIDHNKHHHHCSTSLTRHGHRTRPPVPVVIKAKPKQ